MKKRLKTVLALLLTITICINTADISAYATENDASEQMQEETMISEDEATADEEVGDEDETTTDDETAGEEEMKPDDQAGNEETGDSEEAVDNDEVNDSDESTPEDDTALAEDSEDSENIQNKWDGVTTESVYEGTNFKVKFTLSGYWQGGYNAGITIENTGDTAIENWSLRFPFQDNISNIWNASIDKKQGGVYIIKNAGWNQDIPVSGSVDFGFSASNDFTGFPVEYEMLGQINEKHAEDYSVEYILNSDWGDGFTASVNITNNTSWTLEDWVLEFDYTRQIDNIWNAVITTHEGNHYVIANAGYNANISSGQTVSFGFQGTKGNSTDEPTGYKLHSYEDDTSLRDSDGDGLTDEWENAMGLDPYAKDTDRDGLTDYAEVYLTLTNPLEADTDGDGLIDGEDDMDGDGLTNREELDMGTDPLRSDTDGDNLTDYEEVHDYGTDPLSEDTDGDGLTDYDDVVLGFSPLLADTDGNGIIDSQEKLYQTKSKALEDAKNEGVTEVSVSLTVKGNIENKVAIEDVYEIDTLSSGVVGLIGVPVDISCSEEFEKADITFHYDANALGDTKEEDLAVMWYDEENDWYQILDEDSVVDTQNHTVTYTTTHFSTYMLVDSQMWYDAWRENIDYRNSSSGDTEKHYFDIAFVIDVSGSMLGTRITNAKSAINKFIDSMQEEDEAAIISFTTSAVLRSDFSNDKEDLKKTVNALFASGNTSVNSGMLKAIDTFEKHACDKQNIVVLICDGDVNCTQATIDKCITNDIQIYAINVLSDTSHAALENMASQTNGQYYYASSLSEMETMFGYIMGETTEQIDPTDNDGDGLYDIFETAGIKLSNGQVIYTDPTMQDTDGDGLTDYQETGIVYAIDDRYIGKWTVVKAAYFKLRSDPTLPDTDGDGITDDVDDTPWMMDYFAIAKLDNKYGDINYLQIVENDGTVYDGGDQDWWQDKTTYQYDGIDEMEKLQADEYYRLWQMGCGTVAMSDAELYMTIQNDGYNLSVSSSIDTSSGTCNKDEYRDYLEQMYDSVYPLKDTKFDCYVGLSPWVMESGLSGFFERNTSSITNVNWAKYNHYGLTAQKRYVREDIQKMLGENIPVVFSYYSILGDEIAMYYDLQGAQSHGASRPKNSHYMTVIGLYKCMDKGTRDYRYILEVVSWGAIYYIDYDEYADNLSYFSNILSVY